MDELRKLYDVLYREGKYTKSFEDFQDKWSKDPAYKEKVFQVVSRDGLYTKDKDSFLQKYSGAGAAPSFTSEVKKKESTTGLPSEDGGLVPQDSRQRLPLFKPEGLEQKAVADATFVKKPSEDFIEKRREQAIEQKELEVERKKAEDLFDRQLVKPRVSESAYFKDRLSVINKDLISRTEKYVVPEMRYQFGDLGFKFEEAKIGRDWMNVTAPNGQKIQISLDNFLDSTSEREANKLKNFITENTSAKGLFALEKTMKEQDIKFNSQKQVDEAVGRVNEDVTALNERQKNFLLEKSKYESEISELEKIPASQRNTIEFSNKLNQLENQRVALLGQLNSILSEEEGIKVKGRSLEKAVGKYTISKSKQGDMPGGIFNALLGGFGRTTAGLTSVAIDLMTELAPTGFGMSPEEVRKVTIDKAAKLGVAPPKENQSINDWKKTLTPKQLDDWEDEIDDYIKKSLKKEILPSTRIGLKTLFGDRDTTPEWEDFKKQEFWGGAFLGLAESIPAMIGASGPAGWAQRTAQMYAQISDSIEEEMERNPEFANISESEKRSLTIPIGVVSTALEAYGLRNVLASKGIINSITMAALGRAGRGVGTKTFRELVDNEIESRILKGTLLLGAAGLAEFETGALQEVSETTFKEIYNQIKGKEMFETPDSVLDFVENVVVAGAQEAVGGFVLGVPTSISGAYTNKGFLKLNDATFEAFEAMANDGSLQSAYIASLKEKIAKGEITVDEGKERLNNYRNSVGLFRQLPDGLTTQEKKEAMNLLKEKRDLEQYILGKDESLVTRQKNRIDEINQELVAISNQEAASYKVNGNDVSVEFIDELIKSKSKEELLAMNIEINNDKTGVAERLQAALETLKAEEDAVQIETAGEVPVQPTTGVSEEVAEGVSEAEPQVTTEEGQEKIDEIERRRQEELDRYKGRKANSLVKYNPDGENIELTESEIEEAEMIINSAKKRGLDVDRTQKLLRTNGFVHSVDNSATAFREFLKARLSGEIDNKVNGEFLNTINSKYDSEIAAIKTKEGQAQEVAPAETRIAELEKEKAKLTSKALKQFPQSPAQLKTRARIDEINTELNAIKSEEVSSKTQDDVTTVDTKKEGVVEEVTPSGLPGFNEGVAQVQENANEYRKILEEKSKQRNPSYQSPRTNLAVPKLFTRVSKMISDAYNAATNQPNNEAVKKAYDALVRETKEQYEFIISKGLKVVKHEGTGEPYANSKEMLKDLRENNTLKFLPNEVAFGRGDTDVSDNIGLQPSGIKLEDGYELTNSEVFRIVHDYFGHGILGNQFGAIGEENATLQHLDLYSDEAAPAVIFQTRGQNSWVNFSGANARANELRKQAKELRAEGKIEEANKLLEEADKIFTFAEPKIDIFPTKFNFKRYDTARRINEQEEIDRRPNKRANVLSGLLEKYSKRSSGTRGVNKRDIRRTESIRGNDVNVIAEYTLDNLIDAGIKKAFPKFKGVQRIFEITNGDAYRKMMEESLKDNPFAASVTIHSAEDFNGMRMFVTEDGATGITITKEGFLGGAFSTSDRPNNLAQLMVLGIKEGATTAEAFDTVLPDYYAGFGFKAVSRTAFNDEFRPMVSNGNAVKDWDYETYKKFNNGRPDVVFFIYDGGNRNTIEDRLGLFDLYKNYEKANTKSFDKDGYEQAEEVMKQQAVKRLEFELGTSEEVEQAPPVKEKATPKEEVSVSEVAPVSVSDVKTPNFTKDNAIDFEEDTREDNRGREYAYISSITVEATDADGETIGSITKLSDGEGLLSFTVEDSDGRQINRGKEYPTLRDAKVALAEHANKQRQKEFEKEQKKVAKEKEKAAAKAEKAKAREKAKQKAKEPRVEEEVVEEVQGKMDELLDLDPKEKGTGQKILDGLDGLIKDIEKFEKGTLGVNIALPIMKGILKTIRGLVQAGMTLQEAIKKAAQDNGATVRQVVNGINAISQIAPIQKEFDALMAKADALIKRQKSRGIAEKKIVSNLDTMIRNSEVYKNATDAQRKIMEREARVKMGVGPRKAASIGRVIGVLKDITNVSRKEKLQIISRIRELSRDVAKDLAEEIRELAKEGNITAIQASNIIARFGKVNLLNEISVSNFVDYMAKVFADAEYDNKISRAKSRVAKARKNIATKIGIADGLMLPLQRLFAVNPNIIPDNLLERYLELLDMFSAGEAVLTLEEKSKVKRDVEEILNELNNEQSRADELAELFSNSDNQVFDEDGNLDYAASLKKMLKEGEITDEEASIMRKYKQDIIPQVEPSPLSEEEVNEKKKEYIAALKDMAVSSSELPSQDEINLANRLARLIRTTPLENLMKLGLTDLKNLMKVADNINNNYLPHYAQVMVEKIDAINNAKSLSNAIKRAKPLSFSLLYARMKAAAIRSQKGAIAEMIRRIPLFYVDQTFGDFKTKDIFNALFNKAAEGEANFKAELKKVQNILERAEAKVAKSFKLNPDKTLMSKFKMMTYMIQLEYESNKGSEQVNPASEYLKETIKHIDGGKSRFGERDANMLQEILDKYTKDGQIDINKLYNSFNQAEKDAIKDIRGVNESLKDKAEYTAAIIRGDAIDPLNNYVHLNVLHDTSPLDVSATTDFLSQTNNSRRPSTKAKSLISRTKGAKPLNFDVFTSAQRGAKFVLMDYNLTEPIRTARRTMNQATANLEAEGRIPKQQREIKNAIESAFEETVEKLLTNSILQNSLADEAIDYIGKQGYRAVLAGTGRFVAELVSNIGFGVIADPKALITGTKYQGIIMSTDAPLVLENVNSKQTNRIFPSDTLSGKFIDTSILSQASGIQGRSSKNPVLNKMEQIYNLTLKKPKNFVELTADTLISTPDKLVMRPLWFGSFANEFKKLTGKDVDFKKIAANDQAYMNANKDAIEQSKKTADERSVMAGATDNAFMGILKGQITPNQSMSARAFNNFNNYMTRFLIFEYLAARTGIYAMVGDGTLSKTQGAALLGAVATRMTVYTLLSQMLGNGIMGLIGFGDDEEEDEKSLMQKFGQALTSTFTSLLIGRDFGNATKLLINYGLEEINERYLDFLREGDYDPYRDGIAYSQIPRDKRSDDDLGQLLMNMGGSFSPALNTANLIYKNRGRIITGETTKKDLAAIEREDRTVRERIPLEVLGHMGYIPLYKDVRRAVNNSIYASIKEAKKVAERTKQREKDLLGGYDSKSDLKRYNPALYEKNFGKGSEWYESTKEEREAKEKEAKEKRELKDRLNNYSPKDDGGFGSKGFDEKPKKKQKKGDGGFGSKGFGGN